MPRENEPQRDLDMKAAAYLYGEVELTQEKVAEQLKLSQATVARLLKAAQQQGYLEPVRRRRFRREQVDPQDLDAIKLRCFPYAVREGLAQLAKRCHTIPVQEVHIFHSGSEETSREGLEARLQRFGRGAAGCLLELLKPAEVVGVSWGTTLARVVAALEAYVPWARRRAVPIHFVPTCGEPLGATVAEILTVSSSGLAAQLDRIVNQGQGCCYSLTGIPAVIPASFTGAQYQTLQAFIGQSQAYAHIFGANRAQGGDTLINHMDTLLTSVGSVDQERVKFSAELAYTLGIDQMHLTPLVFGDLGGVLIPRSPLSRSQEQALHAMADRLTGAKRDHYARIASAAARSGRPGVIVVAIGKSKARCLYESIKLGLVNRLVIDHELAKELQRLLTQTR